MSEYDSSLPCIVVVDDEPDQLFLSRRMLEKTGAKNPLVEIGGGPEAIDYLAGCCGDDSAVVRSMPALVFLDLRMPTADGFSVLQWVRSKPALDGVKVILLTSSDEPADVKRGIALGAQAYLVKHPHPAVVACVLRQALGSSASILLAPMTSEHDCAAAQSR